MSTGACMRLHAGGTACVPRVLMVLGDDASDARSLSAACEARQWGATCVCYALVDLLAGDDAPGGLDRVL
jgi:hypothetical protein